MVSISQVGTILKQINQNIENALKQTKLTTKVQLVAVSKTKPVEQLLEVYNEGLRHFGENYVEELSQKYSSLPEGHLQSNKIKQVCIPNLYMIETIDSIKLAQKLDKHLQQEKRNLKVLVQIKTSNEDSKYGINPEDSFELIDFIIKQCSMLEFKGLMTIGMQGDLQAFEQMYKLKQDVLEKFELEDCELSMGMSGDYEQAIINGSTNVRVGSTIFGQRNYPEKKEELK